MDITTTIQGYLSAKVWSPYLVGVSIGILSWLAFLLANHPLGVSTAFAKSAGMIEEAVRGPKVREKPYYQKHPPTIGWEWLFVAGLFFGVGFALLGYCPGTSVGAVGHGALDALIGGVFGIMLGAGLYAAAYPTLEKNVLHIGEFGDKTLIDVLKVNNPWLVIIPAAIIMIAFLIMLESLS